MKHYDRLKQLLDEELVIYPHYYTFTIEFDEQIENTEWYKVHFDHFDTLQIGHNSISFHIIMPDGGGKTFLPNEPSIKYFWIALLS